MKNFLLYTLLIVYSSALQGQSFEFPSSASDFESVQSVYTSNSNSVSLTFTAGQNPKLRNTTNLGIDASTNSILAITIRNTSEVAVIKVKHDKKLDVGNDRFVPFDIEPYDLRWRTYFFDLSNDEWDGATSGTVQDNIELIFRAAGDINVTEAGEIEVRSIEFINQASRLDYTFEVDGNDEGWNARFQSNITVNNGVAVWDLSTNTNTNNPRLRQELFTVNADLNQYAHIVVRNRSADNQIRVNFENSSGNSSGRNANLTPYTSGPGVFEVLDVDMSRNNTNWTGIIPEIEFVSRDTNLSGNASNRTGAIDIERIIFDNNPTLDQPYIYTSAGWEPGDPAGASTSTNNIYVRSDVSLTGDIDFNNLYISENATLTAGTRVLNASADIIVSGSIDASQATINFAGSLQQVLRADQIIVENVILNNSAGVLLNANLELEGVLTLTNGALKTQPFNTPTGVLTFKSSNGKSAIVDEVISGSVDGEVSIEQFYPANRAFRFISSPVNMTRTVYQDWQQEGRNPGDVDYQAGVGFQITGGDLIDGFDQSLSNAPSAFNFNNFYTNVNTAWSAMSTPTTGLSYNAGDPVRVFIRGDRSINLTASGQTPTDTKLITRGNIVTGNQTVSLAGAMDGNFALIGNPYQAQVDLSTVLPQSEDINTNFYYAWNPTSNNYVTYSFVVGNIQSGVSQFIQPGQSYFVLIDDDSDTNTPAIVYTENTKSEDTSTTATYSTPQGIISMTLENEVGVTKDRITIIFNDNGNNAIDSYDAPKFRGADEQIMTNNSGSVFSIEDRLTPVDQEVILLNIENFDSGDYQFTVAATGLNIPAYIEDTYTGQFTLLDMNNTTVIPFTVDTSNINSMDVDRFKLRFSTVTLHTDSPLVQDKISLYPNPSQNNQITISNLKEASEITIINMLGQRVLATESNLDSLRLDISTLKSGSYFIQISTDERIETLKFIKN